jgi:hypothetical protein
VTSWTVPTQTGEITPTRGSFSDLPSFYTDPDKVKENGTLPQLTYFSLFFFPFSRFSVLFVSFSSCPRSYLLIIIPPYRLPPGVILENTPLEGGNYQLMSVGGKNIKMERKKEKI